MTKPLIIWGAAGHAKVLHEFVCSAEYSLVAVFDNRPGTISPFPSVPIFIGSKGLSDWLNVNLAANATGLVAIGGSRGRDRLAIQNQLEEKGVTLLTAVHPRAFVASSTRLGKGCQVLANAAVAVDVALGHACIVNTAASVDHECTLGDGVHIAPGAHLAGLVEVGDFSLIGVGASVLPRVKIGQNCIVGAGSVVTRDLPDNTVAYGNPARIIRSKN